MNGSRLAIQFATYQQQDHAARFGLWVFLASEITLFGGLFTLYAAYRVMYGADFAAGVSQNNLALGTANTFILLTSSLTAALAVAAARKGRVVSSERLLEATLALAVVFLVLKGLEWRQHMREGILPGSHYHYRALPTFGANTFFTLYYLMTGLHALHVLAGMTLLAWLVAKLRRQAYSAEHHLPVELGTLYWHLVDIVWIFLWPLFYLAH